MQVLVRDNNVDQALKALKKKMQREGIFREMKLRPLRKTLGAKGSGEGGSDPPRPQAGAQAVAARGPVADEAEADHRPRRRQVRTAAPAPLWLRHRERFLPMARADFARAFVLAGLG